MASDSALSIASNVIGILTFALAVIATIWLRLNQVRGFGQDLMHFSELDTWLFNLCHTYEEELRIAKTRPPGPFSFYADTTVEKLENVFEVLNPLVDRENAYRYGYFGWWKKMALFVREPIRMRRIRRCIRDGDACRAKLASNTLIELAQKEVLAAALRDEHSKLLKAHGELLGKIWNVLEKKRDTTTPVLGEAANNIPVVQAVVVEPQDDRPAAGTEASSIRSASSYGIRALMGGTPVPVDDIEAQRSDSDSDMVAYMLASSTRGTTPFTCSFRGH